MARTQKEKKDKKALLALLLLLLAIVIIIASALAFFSDTISGAIGATAGTLDIELSTFTGTQYWTAGGNLDTFGEDDTAAERLDNPTKIDFTEYDPNDPTTGIQNLNPGDAIVLDLDVENFGNKSAYVRAILGNFDITLDPVVVSEMKDAIVAIQGEEGENGEGGMIGVLMAEIEELDEDEDAAEILKLEGKIVELQAEVLKIQTQLTNPGSLFKLLAVNDTQTISDGALTTLITTGKNDTVFKLADNGDPIILNGKGDNAEEDGDDYKSSLQYVLYFDKEAINVLQRAIINYEIIIQAMQYRNNTLGPDIWNDVTSVPFSLTTP